MQDRVENNKVNDKEETDEQFVINREQRVTRNTIRAVNTYYHFW